MLRIAVQCSAICKQMREPTKTTPNGVVFSLALSPTVLEQHCHRAHAKREQGQSRGADLPRGVAEQGHMVQVRRLVCKKTRRCRQAVVLIRVSPINATHCGSMSSYLQANGGAKQNPLS